MATADYSVTLTKVSKRHLNPKIIATNTNSLLASVNTRALRASGWSLVTQLDDNGMHWTERAPTKHDGKAYDGSDPEYATDSRLVLRFESDTKPIPPRHELDSHVLAIHKRADSAPYGDWHVSAIDGKRYEVPADGEVTSSAELIGYSEVRIPEDFWNHFDHLFGLHHHVTSTLGAINAGIASNFRNRFHTVLQGPPGCGKSEICRAFKAALGDDAVMEFDATATTAAGAIKDLSEREILPRLLIVEEIEKADPKALAFLLGVLDLRGEIRKITARNNIQRDTKLIVIATCNDWDLFQSLMSGALASRFTNPVHFSRPSRDTLALILAREIARIDGDARWIEPALDYAETISTTDPRRIMALCLCGADGWIDGSYRVTLDATALNDNVLN